MYLDIEARDLREGDTVMLPYRVLEVLHTTKNVVIRVVDPGDAAGEEQTLIFPLRHTMLIEGR